MLKVAGFVRRRVVFKSRPTPYKRPKAGSADVADPDKG